MNKHHKAFSLLEILAVLCLIMLLYGIFSSEFKVNLNYSDPQSQLNTILDKARQIAIRNQENIFLIKNLDNTVLTCNQYGEIINRQKVNFKINFYDKNDRPLSNIKLFSSGFTSEYVITINEAKYTIDPLSLYVYKIKI